MTGEHEFIKQCRREFLINLRQPRQIVNPLLFFIMIIVFFPLTMPANHPLLKQVAAASVWIGILLAMILAGERFFQQDYDDGVIEQWLISGQSLAVIIMAKMVVHWLLIVVPIVVFLPWMALLFNFSIHEIGVLVLSIVTGTPAILALSGFAAAFSTGLEQKSLLMAIILLPLTIPVMVFGSNTFNSALLGLAIQGHLSFLLAFAILTIAFIPFAIAAIIRISLAA